MAADGDLTRRDHCESEIRIVLQIVGPAVQIRVVVDGHAVAGKVDAQSAVVVNAVADDARRSAPDLDAVAEVVGNDVAFACPRPADERAGRVVEYQYAAVSRPVADRGNAVRADADVIALYARVDDRSAVQGNTA